MPLSRLKILFALGSLTLLILFGLTAVYSSKTALLLHAYSPMDDAYIFVRYAHNILGGHGVVWNPGEGSTYGASSALYLGILTAAMGASSLDVGVILQILSWSMAVAFAFAVVWAVRSQCRSDVMRSTALILFLVMAFVFTSKAFLYHALTGMETTTALVTNTLLIGLVLRLIQSPSTAKAIGVGVLGWLCYSARPETGLYAVFFPLAAIWLMGSGKRLALIAWCLGTLAVLIGLDLIVKQVLFGSPLPLAFFVKRLDFYEGYTGHANWNTAGYVLQFIQEVLPFLFILIFTAQRKHLRMIAAFLFPVFLHIIYLFFVVQIMGNNARYYYTALPFVIVPAMITLDDFIAEERSVRNLIPRLASCALLFVMVSTLFGEKVAGYYRIHVLAAKDSSNNHYIVPSSRTLPTLKWTEALAGVSKIVSKLPSGAVVAMSEVGYPGVVAPNVSIIDLAGLNDNVTARGGFSVDKLLDRKPDFVWLPHQHYTRLTASLINSPRFQREYDVIPDAFDYGIAIRKHGPYRETIIKSLRQVWHERYPGIPLPAYP
ncbi:MAG: hypothetical protein Q8K75_04685 [Chlamydiales bacterium]|nr:hypothetical protein [Chlamydiales bacterium]